MAVGWDGVGPGTVIGGAYEVTGLIGRGGASIVWSACHLRLRSKEVAIKVLDPRRFGVEARANQIRAEAETLSRINHPNIVQVLDYAELDDGTPCLVLERLRGETLSDRLRHGRLPIDLALEIALQVGSALSAAHHAQVIHGDVKPGNIFLSPTIAPSATRFHVKVLDFGLATPVTLETLPSMSSLGGTPQYMAPEQVLGADIAGRPRTDVFAMGAVVYEMLAGRPAFGGESIAEVAMRVAYRQPEPLRGLVPGLAPATEAAVMGALAKEPEKRFQSASAFTAALVQTGRESPERRRTRRPSVRSWLLAALVVVALAGAGLGWYFLEDWFPPPVDYLAIAVFEFENLEEEQQRTGRGRILQSDFVTQLSRIPGVVAISPEEVRRKALSNHLNVIHAARELNAGHFVTGEFVVIGDVIRIDARMVGMERRNPVKSAQSVEGPEHEFLNLQRSLIRLMLDDIQTKLAIVDVPPIEEMPAAAVSKFSLLLEAEGVVAPVARVGDQGSLRDDSATNRSGPLVFAGSHWSTLFVSPAAAAEGERSAVVAEAERVMEEYRRAHERGDVDGLRALYVTLADRQGRAMRAYADSVAELRVQLRDVHIDAQQSDVVVSYTRRDSFIDKETGEPITIEVRLTKFLVEDGGALKFAAEP